MTLCLLKVNQRKKFNFTNVITERLEMMLNAYAAAAAPNRYEPNPCLSKAEFEAISEDISQLLNTLDGSDIFTKQQ
ncbi:Hypothetical predicted protein [Cloeon dipterum]|uniref:Uncharacterized protein n=1 Tax=Cloeon dipterum TaxID=197152 RepID=A0A8S1E9W1_9INSE|nr:Hypothetical predicted protein [Cloeon dipterum]